MASTDNGDKTAVVQFRIKEGEYALLLRIRQLRNQAGEHQVFRLELELGKDSIDILTQQLIKREAFTIV